MIFKYTYRTSDGAWHEGSIEAADKSAAYDAIKGNGIRPVKVWCPSPPRFRWSKRVVAIVVLALALFAAFLYGFLLTSEARPGESVPRHRILSAPSDFASEAPKRFTYSSERFLALHAQPGLIFPLQGCGLDDLAAALEKDNPPDPADPDWVADLKRIVMGMKIEAGILLRNGKDPSTIALWLEERQKMEATYRNQIIATPGTLEEKAVKLRAMGL